MRLGPPDVHGHSLERAAADRHTSAPLAWLIPLLVCPVCGGSLTYTRDDGAERHGILAHDDEGCSEAYPVIDAIPRLLVGPHRAALVRAKSDWFGVTPRRGALAAAWLAAGGSDRRDVVTSFDREWSRFRRVGTHELRRVFERYFDIVPPAAFAGCTVLDAGCGAGRWAYEAAVRGARVIAVDLGASVELAQSNTAAIGNVACVQADVGRLPLLSGAVDWAYTLGVLHHLDRPSDALAQVVRAVRPGGSVLVYVYYALDGRGPAFRAMFRAVDALRRVTSRLPHPAVLAVATVIAVLVYLPLARASALLAQVGLGSVARGVPLETYRTSSFTMMWNDSLDRFGTRQERRYTRDAVVRLMSLAGLGAITVSPHAPFWHALGIVDDR